MDFVFAALVGWCGTRWPRWPFPWPPGPDPDPRGPHPDPWRVLRDGVIGAIAGAVVYGVLGNHFTSAGMVGIAILSFAAGRVAADIVGGAIDMAMPRG
jgi:hypothetical protein